MHPASALAIDDAGLVVAVWDRRLHAGAPAAGIRAAPAEPEAGIAPAGTTPT